MKKNIKYGCFLTLLVYLMGCSHDKGDEAADIKHFISKLKKKPVTDADEKSPIVWHKPPAKIEEKIRSPFPEQATTVLDAAKTPLERYPLNALHLVGIVQENGSPFIVIRTPDKKIYNLRVGDHVGSEQGIITAIQPRGILVTQPVNPETGLSTEKTVVLRLQGSPAS